MNASRELASLKESFGRVSAELTAERESASTIRSELDTARTQLTAAQNVIAQLSVEKTDLTTRLETEREQAAEKLQLLNDAKQTLTDQFKSLANDILEEKSKRFVEQNQTNLGQLLDPLKSKITEFQSKVEDVYVKETKDRSALGEQVRQLMALNQSLSTDAKNLTQALKGSNKAQGNYGELVLERVLESSGLRNGEEYEIQANHTREDGLRAQPDVVIRLPENRNLVLDSKISLVAYDESVSAEGEEDRIAAIARHIASVRAHIKGLSAKNYHHVLGWLAPYPLMSGPVVLGTVGGVAMVIGAAGLLWLKKTEDASSTSPDATRADEQLLWLLLLVALSGLALLALRETAAMASLLALHLGLVCALFFAMPYGKFVHFIYRYAALVRFRQEQRQSAGASVGARSQLRAALRQETRGTTA